MEEVVKHLESNPEWAHIQDGYGNIPLHYAACKGRDEIVELLLHMAYIDTPNKTATTPLHLAAEKGHHSTVELLLSMGSQSLHTQNEDRLTPLHLAVWCGECTTIELLLGWGSVTCGYGSKSVDRSSFTEPLDVPDIDGHTPLHYAVQLEHKNVVRILRAVGAATASFTSEIVSEPLSEDAILEIRHRIYFRRSLLSVLLL